MRCGEQYDDPARLAELLRAAAEGRAYLPTSANVGDELRAAAHWFERKAHGDAEQRRAKKPDERRRTHEADREALVRVPTHGEMRGSAPVCIKSRSGG